MKDVLHKYLALDNQVRVITLTSTNLLNHYFKQLNCSPVTKIALGRLMSAGAMMGAMLKGEETVALKITGDGPIGTLIAESNGIGDLKGYVKNPDVYLPEDIALSVKDAIGFGQLSVKKKLRNTIPFEGVVDLTTSEIAEDLCNYYLQSEQTSTIVALSVLLDNDLNIKVAGGFIIQVLPNPKEEVYEKLAEVIKKVDNFANILAELDDSAKIITKLFEKSLEIDLYPVRFKCICSRNYSKKVLATLQEDELKEIVAENKGIDIECNFCRKHYYVNSEMVEKIYRRKII